MDATLANKTLKARTLKGTWGTLLLPIQRDECIDEVLLVEEIAVMTEAHLDGIYSNGTAGEFHNQTETEFDRVQALLAEKCYTAGIPFQIGVSHMSPIISLERLKRSKSLHPGAFQVILPDWVAPSDEEQITFLQRMAEAADPVPLVLYNPPHAKKVLQPQDYQRLSQAVPQLIGIKVADGDARWYADMRQCPNSLAVFVPGHHLATGMQEGIGVGAYSNVACLSPKGAQRWYRLMQEDIKEALQIEQQIKAFFAQCMVPLQRAGYTNPALDKLLAAVGGWASIGTRLRWPYRGVPEEMVPDIRQAAQQFLPAFFFEHLKET